MERNKLRLGIVGKTLSSIFFYILFFGIAKINDAGPVAYIFIFIVVSIWIYKVIINPKIDNAELKYQKELELEQKVHSSYSHLVLIGMMALFTIAVSSYFFAIKLFLPSLVAFSFFTLGSFMYMSKRLAYAKNNTWLGFAKQNNFSFSKQESVADVEDKLLLIDVSNMNDRIITNVLSSKLQDHPFRLFNFRYKWANKAENEIQLFEWSLPTKRPDMLVLSKSSVFSETINPERIFAGIQTILEGNFSDRFNVFVEKGSEDEVRQFLTPDIMVHLLDELPEYSFLFLNNKIYVITEPTLPNETLPILTKVKAILLKTETVLSKID